MTTRWRCWQRISWRRGRTPLDLLRQFTDEQLAAPMPTVGGERTAGDFFAGRAGHATEHMTAIEEGLRQGV